MLAIGVFSSAVDNNNTVKIMVIVDNMGVYLRKTFCLEAMNIKHVTQVMDI